MNMDMNLPMDDIATGAATQLVKLAISDGWNAAKSLLKKLTMRGDEAGAQSTELAIPEPAGALDEAFTQRLAGYLRADPELTEAVRAYFGTTQVGSIGVTLHDNAQAAVQGSGTQTNVFRAP
jgi:hypothetical protein